MSNKPIPLITVNQMEEALEERVRPDRRKKDLGLPKGVSEDRRKRVRRAHDRGQN